MIVAEPMANVAPDAGTTPVPYGSFPSIHIAHAPIFVGEKSDGDVASIFENGCVGPVIVTEPLIPSPFGVLLDPPAPPPPVIADVPEGHNEEPPPPL